MRIFIAHSSGYDYKKDLYEPIQHSSLFTQYEIIFPMLHKEYEGSQETIRSCDLLIAEVSLPSTGAGIELGYADIFNIPVVCMYRKGNPYSGALNKITKEFIAYENAEDLINKLEKCIEEYTPRKH